MPYLLFPLINGNILPQEFLALTEKIEMLEDLKVSLTNEKNKVIVEDVIEQVKNQKKNNNV